MSRLDRIFLLISLLPGLGCRDHQPVRPATATVIFRTDAAASQYFPATIRDSMPAARRGDILRAMHEPPLFGATVSARVTVLRFLWLRAFHSPIAVRIVMLPSSCTVATTVLDVPQSVASPPSAAGTVQGFTMPGPGPIERRDSTMLPLASCVRLEHQLAMAGFWTEPIVALPAGFDGSEWIFEGADSARYQLVARWSPDSSRARAYRQLGESFLRLGRALPPTSEIY